MRTATKYDKPIIKDLMRSFRDESTYLDHLLDSILAGQGIIFIEENKGLIIGMITPSVWNDKVLIMHELAWYVKPEYRKSSIGYRLFMAYRLHGKELQNNGRIKYFTMTKLDTSPLLKYEKYGFKKKDENWIQ